MNYNNYRGRGRGGPFMHAKNYRNPNSNTFNNQGSRLNNSNNCMPLLPILNYRETTSRWQRPQQNMYSWKSPAMTPRFPHTQLFRHRMPQPVISPPPVNLRPVSPLPGSEEARQKAIAEASARIKEQLNLNEGDINGRKTVTPPSLNDRNNTHEQIDLTQKPYSLIDNNQYSQKTPEKITRKKVRKSVNSVQCNSTDIEVLRKKILTQFTYMSKGKIQNLVNNPGSTRYDAALKHIIRDMRLHLSAELRNMYNSRESDGSEESNEMIDRFNSIIPDLGIELVSLPDAMVEELSKILQLDTNDTLEDVTPNNDCVLVKPEEFFKQAEQMLSNSNYLGSDIVDKVSDDFPLPENYSEYYEANSKNDFVPENIGMFEESKSRNESWRTTSPMNNTIFSFNKDLNIRPDFSSSPYLNNSFVPSNSFYQNNSTQNYNDDFPTNFNQFSNVQQFSNPNINHDVSKKFEYTRDTFCNNRPPNTNDISISSANVSTNLVAQKDTQQSSIHNSHTFCSQNILGDSQNPQPSNEMRSKNSHKEQVMHELWTNPSNIDICTTKSGNYPKTIEHDVQNTFSTLNNIAGREMQDSNNFILGSPSAYIHKTAEQITCSNENRLNFTNSNPNQNSNIFNLRTSQNLLESSNINQTEQQKFDFNSIWLTNTIPINQNNLNISETSRNNFSNEPPVHIVHSSRESFELGIAWLESLNKNTATDNTFNVENETNIVANPNDTHEPVFTTMSKNIFTNKQKKSSAVNIADKRSRSVDNLVEKNISTEKTLYTRDKLPSSHNKHSNKDNECSEEQSRCSKTTDSFTEYRDKKKEDKEKKDKQNEKESTYSHTSSKSGLSKTEQRSSSNSRSKSEKVDSPKIKRLSLDERIRLLQETHESFRNYKSEPGSKSKRYSKKKQKQYERKLAYFTKKKIKQLSRLTNDELDENIIENKLINTANSSYKEKQISVKTNSNNFDKNSQQKDLCAHESTATHEHLQQNELVSAQNNKKNTGVFIKKNVRQQTEKKCRNNERKHKEFSKKLVNEVKILNKNQEETLDEVNLDKTEKVEPNTFGKPIANTSEIAKLFLKIKTPREVNEDHCVENSIDINISPKVDENNECANVTKTNSKKAEELEDESALKMNIIKDDTVDETVTDSIVNKNSAIDDAGDIVKEKQNLLNENCQNKTNISSNAAESQIANENILTPIESANMKSASPNLSENTIINSNEICSKESKKLEETPQTDRVSIEPDGNIQDKTENKVSTEIITSKITKQKLSETNKVIKENELPKAEENIEQKTSNQNKKESKTKCKKGKLNIKGVANEVQNNIESSLSETQMSKSSENMHQNNTKQIEKEIDETLNNSNVEAEQNKDLSEKENTVLEKESVNSVHDSGMKMVENKLSCKQNVPTASVEKSATVIENNRIDINKKKVTSTKIEEIKTNNDNNNSKEMLVVKKQAGKRKHDHLEKSHLDLTRLSSKEITLENKKAKYKQEQLQTVKQNSKKIKNDVDNSEKVKNKTHGLRKSEEISAKRINEYEKNKNSTDEVNNQNLCLLETKSKNKEKVKDSSFKEKHTDKLKLNRKHLESAKHKEDQDHISKNSKEVSNTSADNKNDNVLESSHTYDKPNKETCITQENSTQTSNMLQEDILKRIMAIDFKIQELMEEKLELYKQLELTPVKKYDNETTITEYVEPPQNIRKRRLSITVSESSAFESVPENMIIDLHELSDSENETIIRKKRKIKEKNATKKSKKTCCESSTNHSTIHSNPSDEHILIKKKRKNSKSKFHQKLKHFNMCPSGSDSESNKSLKRLNRRSQSLEKINKEERQFISKDKIPDEKDRASRRSTSLEKICKDETSEDLNRISRRSVSVEKVNKEDNQLNKKEKIPNLIIYSTTVAIEHQKARTKKRKKRHRTYLNEMNYETMTNVSDDTQAEAVLHQNVKPCSVRLERINLDKSPQHLNTTDNVIEITNEVSDINVNENICDENLNTFEQMPLNENDKKDLLENCDGTDIIEKEIHSNNVSALSNTYDAIDEKGLFCIGHQKSILDIKLLNDEFLAASEDGTIYKFCLQTGSLQDAYTGHKKAVTSMQIINGTILDLDAVILYSGSLDSTLKCWNIETAEIIDEATVQQPIQCMDSAWGYIFLGTYNGFLFIYNIKKKLLNEESLTIASATVLMLKATQEGSRQVLILASRKREIMVRDAFTGLLLRTMCQDQKPTIYSLFLDRSMVYCGTSDKGILVIDFNNGNQISSYNAGKGVVCMLMHGPLLFAGCYDGMIYVYNTRTQKQVTVLSGPGDGMLLSLAITDSLIIAGTKREHLLKIWKIPQEVLEEMI